VLRDPDHCAYFKEDAGKLLLGAFEPNAIPWATDGIPEDFEFGELPENFDHFTPILEAAMRRIPALESVGIRKFFNGPESFTPDVRYMLGEAPELAASSSRPASTRPASSRRAAPARCWRSGSSTAIRRWISGTSTSAACSPSRANKSYLADRVSESLGLLYAMHWPYRQYENARGVRTSPLYEQLASRGACFGETAGWERANWFAPTGETPEYRYSYKRQNWFPHAASEHRAVREACALFDQSSFAKFLVQGRDARARAAATLRHDVAVAPGRIIYTQWLNERAASRRI